MYAADIRARLRCPIEDVARSIIAQIAASAAASSLSATGRPHATAPSTQTPPTSDTTSVEQDPWAGVVQDPWRSASQTHDASGRAPMAQTAGFGSAALPCAPPPVAAAQLAASGVPPPGQGMGWEEEETASAAGLSSSQGSDGAAADSIWAMDPAGMAGADVLPVTVKVENPARPDWRGRPHRPPAAEPRGEPPQAARIAHPHAARWGGGGAGASRHPVERTGGARGERRYTCTWPGCSYRSAQHDCIAFRVAPAVWN